MTNLYRTRRWSAALTLCLFAALTFVGCDSDDPTTGASAEVTVMTYNLYLGAEIFALVGTTPEAIPAVAGSLFDDVRDTDFPARAGAIAAIIADENPALIGLQEVTWYRSGPGNDPAPATDEEFNFLTILQDSLSARGLDYRVAATTTNADVELPAIVDGGLRDIRLTDRDVIMARDDVETSDVVEKTFDIAAPIPVAGMEVPFTRGYNSVLATIDDVTFTFANSHLEVNIDGLPAGTPQPQEIQALQLVGELRDRSPVVLVGDFNSAADGSTTNTYATLTATYTDAADEVGATGDTCCQNALLSNPSSSFASRIDLILYRGSVTATNAKVVGDESTDLGGPQWPSDHAGVVATLRIEN